MAGFRRSTLWYSFKKSCDKFLNHLGAMHAHGGIYFVKESFRHDGSFRKFSNKKIKIERLDMTDFLKQKYFDSMTPIINIHIFSKKSSNAR